MREARDNGGLRFSKEQQPLRLREPREQRRQARTAAFYKSEAELRESAELSGWEAAWQGAANWIRGHMSVFDQGTQEEKRTMAALGLGWGVSALPIKSREIVAEGAALPFAKYLLPSEREIFMELSPEDQVRSLGWEAFGAGLWAAGPLIAKAKGPAKKLARFWKGQRELKVVPLETAVGNITSQGGQWRVFDYRNSTRKALQSKGFAKDEAATIARILDGADPVGMQALQYEKGLVGKKMSTAWTSYVKSPPVPYGKPTLRKEIAETLDYATMQRKHYSRLVRDNLKQHFTGIKTGDMTGLMSEQARKFYGPEMAARFADNAYSQEEAANLIGTMLTPRGQKSISQAHKLAMGRWALPWLRPERHVYETGEAAFKTKSKLFDVLDSANKNTNRYTHESVEIFMGMLEQRGFGKVIKGHLGLDFQHNKELWNSQTLDNAKRLLTRIDNLAEQARQGKKVQKQEAKAAIEELLDNARDDAPAVFALVDATRGYYDYLYKDFVKRFVPKVMNRAGLSAQGSAEVSQLENLYLPKLEQAFTNGDYATRVKTVKTMLKDYERLVKKPGTFNEFNTTKLQELQEGLLKRLKYNSSARNGVPAYLEHYSPRISGRGSALETGWKRQLLGEHSAGFQKHRTREELRDDSLLSFQQMIEARTRAQAKQLYFYDEVGDAVSYASTLPQAWQKHFDFGISRVLGQPSAWDDMLATVLQKMPGAGTWDAHRAMRAAQTVTGLQYTGLLGLRPFAAIRNLVQHPMMTPAELGGGGRSYAATLRGIAFAGSHEHRKYINGIGAISEFVPELRRGQILPKTGVTARYEQAKDAMMWMFMKSDRLNRYMTGGSAVNVWESARKTDGTFGSAFRRKMKLHTRPAYEQREIEALLDLGRTEEAKATYVKGVIAETQYLYDPIQAPSALGRGGAQRMMTSFNSWWANYGTAVERWTMTGEGSDRFKRTMAWLVSSAAAEQFLELYTTRETALRNTFLGPFPFGTLAPPPALEPIIEGLKIVGSLSQGELDDDAFARAVSRSLKAAGTTYVPGGLAAYKAGRGYAEDEWSGLAKGILEYRGDED